MTRRTIGLLITLVLLVVPRAPDAQPAPHVYRIGRTVARILVKNSRMCRTGERQDRQSSQATAVMPARSTHRIAPRHPEARGVY
jgi:hypothetical protein